MGFTARYVNTGRIGRSVNEFSVGGDLLYQPARTEYYDNISGQKGAEAAISFTGTGVSITGILLPNGGKAEVYLDGELSRAIDVYPDEPTAKARESIWHAFGLENKRHDVLVVVLGESYGDSQGTDISISGLLVFQ